MTHASLPVLPLTLAGVPDGLAAGLAQEGIAFVPQGSQSAAGRFVLFDSLRGSPPVLAAGQIAIDVHPLRIGCEEDPFRALEDTSARRYGWRLGGLTVCEEVARVDKRAVRERLMTGLRSALEAVGGIWLRVAPYPHPCRSAFNFRIDHDDYLPRDFAATLEALAGHEDSISHYVCASTHVNHPEAMARLRGRHVGSHGYWHHTYADAAENLANVGRGIEALERAGLRPSGFAAPYGRFNVGLLTALERLDVTHSSEFGLAYDDLPFFPAGGSVLQIPIHPICLGICLEAARGLREQFGDEVAAQVTLEHFQQVADEKWQAGQPIFLYGHPAGRLGRYSYVLRGLLETVAGFRGVWRTTLKEFENWWRQRAQVRLRVYQELGQVVVHVENLPAGYRCAIEYWRGEHVAAVPLDAQRVALSAEAPAFESRRPIRRSYPVRFDRPEGLKATLRRYLDWERVTPVDEISTRTWRGWAKRGLRRLKG